MCLYMCYYTHTYILCKLRGPSSGSTPSNSEDTQSMVSNTISHKKNYGSMKKSLTLGQEIYKMSLEQLEGSGIQEVPKTPEQKNPKRHNDEGMSKGQKEPTKRTPQGQN